MSYSPPVDEEALYKPVHNFIEQRFQDRLRPTYGDLLHVSSITARAGGPGTGLWSKPDLACVALWRFKYGLEWHLDVHGFEVKPAARCDLTAVHEALNHTSMVNYSHLVWHKPDWKERDSNCAAILERCERHGIGLITFSDERNADTFLTRVQARRHAPDGNAVDEFIETRFESADRETLSKWIAELR